MESGQEREEIIFVMSFLQLRGKSSTFWFDCEQQSFVWQVMVTNVTSLLKTVKAVEDEATRGTRALEATIECIKQELTVRAPHRAWTSSVTSSFGSQLMRHSLSAKAGSNRVRDIYVYYSEQNRGALCPFFFIICPTPFLPASLSAPVGFSQLLSGSG